MKAFHAHVHSRPLLRGHVKCVNTEAVRAAHHILYDRCNTLLIILMSPMNTDNVDAATCCTA